MSVVVREAVPGDARAISRIRVEVWRTTYRGLMPDHVLAGLDAERDAEGRERRLRELPADWACLVADDEDVTVGFLVCGPSRDAEHGKGPTEGEVYAIYVLDSHQRRGIGGALLREAARRLGAQDLRRAVIWVLRENAKGRAFYERHGGRAERERPFTIEGVSVIETGYVWDDVATLAP